MVITSLFDSVAGRYLGLVPNDSCEAAIRAFKNEFSRAYGDTSSMLFTNYSDFDLYYLADFDTHTGVVTPVQPVVLAKGSQIFAQIDMEVNYDDKESE